MTKTAYCFDLDGTVTQEEVSPKIAKEVGIFEEINTLTQATLDGLINFESSLKLRCRLLDKIPISRIREIISNIKLNKEIVHFIQNNKSNSYIVTGSLDAWVIGIIQKIGCQFFASEAIYNDDTLLGIRKVITKSDAVNLLRKKYNKIVAIGDSMNDVSMFEAADVGIAYGGVHYPTESLINSAQYVVFNERSLCHILKMQ